MEDRVKKSLWIITVITALLIPIICSIVTVGRVEYVRFITSEVLKELIEKKRAKLTLPFLFISNRKSSVAGLLCKDTSIQGSKNNKQPY
jgi:hypothetical protein